MITVWLKGEADPHKLFDESLAEPTSRRYLNELRKVVRVDEKLSLYGDWVKTGVYQSNATTVVTVRWIHDQSNSRRQELRGSGNSIAALRNLLMSVLTGAIEPTETFGHQSANTPALDPASGKYLHMFTAQTSPNNLDDQIDPRLQQISLRPVLIIYNQKFSATTAILPEELEIFTEPTAR